jgi:hypothetical protein
MPVDSSVEVEIGLPALFAAFYARYLTFFQMREDQHWCIHEDNTLILLSAHPSSRDTLEYLSAARVCVLVRAFEKAQPSALPHFLPCSPIRPPILS